MTGIVAVVALAFISLPAHAVTFDGNDFLLLNQFSNDGEPIVFDHDLTEKGRLDGGRGFVGATGMAFTPDGGLAVNDSTFMNLYDASGVFQGYYGDLLTQKFPIGDLRVTAGGNFLIAGAGVKEYSTTAQLLRTFGSSPYQSIELLPGGVLWAGRRDQSSIDVFNVATGELLETIALSDGQNAARGMHFSRSTNTVLVTGIS